MIDYNIINISQVKIDHLSEFYKKAFNKRHITLIKHWKWWYRNNYLGYEPLILSYRNEIIGQAGLIPVKIRINNKTLPAIWFVDFVILPKFQGKGFGKILTEAWMKICPNQITYCNDKSLKIFKKFGWVENKFTQRLARPINPLKWVPFFKKFEFNFLDKLFKDNLKKKIDSTIKINPYSFEENYKVIFDSFNKNFKILSNNNGIVRDEEWLNWRLMECPFKNNIRFFEYKGNIAIAHIFISNQIKRLNILYLLSINESDENLLLNAIFDWSLNNSIDLIWANTNNSEQIKKFKNILPEKFNKSMNFASWSSDEKVHEELKLGLNNSQGIDSDNDIISIDDKYL